MKLLTKKQLERMLRNYGACDDPRDLKPVVKLYCPWTLAIWLLAEIDPDEPDLAFGLRDPGTGYPELATVSLSELARLRGPDGLCIERDPHFKPTKTLLAYGLEARARFRQSIRRGKK